MSGGDGSNVMTIEDAFAKTLADMEDAREELDSLPEPEPVDDNSPSLDSAFEAGISEVEQEEPTPLAPLDPPISDSHTGPPMDAPPAGPPMMGPPPGPPSPPPSEDSDESSFQVADLSEITSDLESEEESTLEIEPSEVFDESIFEGGSTELSDSTADVEAPETNVEPEFNPVNAEDFMSDFQDEWDESAPVRVSDIDRTEDMDW
ncbi:MAG: hypothetical protein QGH13_03395 [Candidatus Thalassarchaeaceae archaeon]|nr:hypothetical protein [Candidatus Thalassarchaeaceae archaeon]